jgi:hypothetical protein
MNAALIQLLVALGMKAIDLASAWLSGWINRTAKGQAYVSAAQSLSDLPASASPEVRKKHQEAKVEAFRAFVGL